MWPMVMGAVGAFIVGHANGYYACSSACVRRMSFEVSIATVIWFAVLAAGTAIPADVSNLNLMELMQRFGAALIMSAISHVAGLAIGRGHARHGS